MMAINFKMQEIWCGGRNRLVNVAGFSLMAVLFAVSAMAQEPTPTPRQLPENIEMFTVSTQSKQNREVPFYLRIPAVYNPKNKERVHRLLYICPHYNGDALEWVWGRKRNPELLEMAEERGWFVLSGTFKQQGSEVRDRKASYYYPESFSGRAVVEALEHVAKKYPIDPTRILMQGLSGGAQFVHRFAIWAPERVSAVAINSTSWLDKPNTRCNLVAWLVTIGESDRSFTNTLDFIDQLRGVGAAPLFRSYMGMVHEGSPSVTRLNLAFLRFYDERSRHELGQRRSRFTRPEDLLALKAEDMPFVGDCQDWKYFPNTEENRENLAEDSRIFLPSGEIAQLWGQEEEEE